MRRGFTIAAAVISSVALIGFGAGCGGNDTAALTPEDAVTIENNAPQTDSQGKTVPAPGGAPAGDAAAGGVATDAAPDETGGTAVGVGDVAAGKTVFEANCQGCHAAGGTQAGVGPQLSNTALDAAGITMVVQNGRGAMPGGLVSGADLDNVVAYVESIKG
jgi:mono/diheme cytochrome c family protein